MNNNPYLRAGIKGLTFGLSEPIGAALASGMSYLMPQGNRPMTFQEAYAAEVAKRQAERQQSPVGYTLAELAGAIPPAIATGQLGTRVAVPLSALLGGTAGGLETQTSTGAAIGAGLGAIGGIPLSKLLSKQGGIPMDPEVAKILAERPTSITAIPKTQSISNVDMVAQEIEKRLKDLRANQLVRSSTTKLSLKDAYKQVDDEVAEMISRREYDDAVKLYEESLARNKPMSYKEAVKQSKKNRELLNQLQSPSYGRKEELDQLYSSVINNELAQGVTKEGKQVADLMREFQILLQTK